MIIISSFKQNEKSLLWCTDVITISVHSHDITFNFLHPTTMLSIWISNLGQVIFKLISVINGCDICSVIALTWMSLDLTDDKSTLFLVMAWCHKATSHYLNQCGPRSMSPYGATGPQWVKPFRLSAIRQHSITWANVDPDPCHLDHNELTHWGQDKMAAFFPDDIFKWIFFNENVWISINISLKFVPRGLINNIPAIKKLIEAEWRIYASLRK